jgi:hypothetical protein
MWKNGEPIFSTSRVTNNNFIALSGIGGAPYQGEVPELEKELISRFDTDHLLKLAFWLAEKHYGCGPDGRCKDAGIGGRRACQMLYAIGRIYELSGDIENAHKIYLRAQSQQNDKLGWWTDFIQTGLERTQPES